MGALRRVFFLIHGNEQAQYFHSSYPCVRMVYLARAQKALSISEVKKKEKNFPEAEMDEQLL